MLSNAIVAALSAAIIMSATQAQAMVVGFDDRATFLAAGGAATNHITPVVPSGTTSAVDFGGITVGPVTSNFLTVEPSPSGITNALLFSDRDGENFNVFIDEESFGFGFDIFEPISGSLCNTASCTASTFEVTLLSGASEVGSLSFAPTPSDLATSFFGVISTMGFNTVQVRETIGSNDNESFGNFTTVAAVPLPAPFALLMAGLGGLALLRYRRSA